MSHHVDRGILLYQQRRYDLACPEFQAALSHEPDNSEALAYLALCRMHQKRYREAVELARQGVAAGPADPFSHQVLALVLYGANRVDEAERAIFEAIDLLPVEPAYWHLAGLCSLRKSLWQEALERADRGLEHRPADPDCLNLRSLALMRLGRLGEARLGLEESLREHPENPDTLANLGWSFLHRGDRKAALEHFKEALRIDPEHEYGREGLLEALRLQYPLYGLILRFFLKMAGLSPQGQYAVMVGLLMLMRFVADLARRYRSLRPFLGPLRVLYSVFAYLTWTARPLTNLLLRLNPYGRMVLTREEVLESNLVGGCLATAGVTALAGAATGNEVLKLSSVYFLTMVVPVSCIYQCLEGWPRQVMQGVTLFLAGLGALGLMLMAAGVKACGPVLMLYVCLLLPCDFLASYLMRAEPQH
ncbi:MAG: tetratricopeptide repeat protein [Candidatus Eremiobacterota bacterium]